MGFEPMVRFRTLPFQGSKISRSDISPNKPLLYHNQRCSHNHFISFVIQILHIPLDSNQALHP